MTTRFSILLDDRFFHHAPFKGDMGRLENLPYIRVGYCRLTERYPAITGRHTVMGKDLEARRAEQLAGLFKQQLVLKNAARERHTVEPVNLPETRRHVFDHLRHAMMKSRRCQFGGDAGK